MNEPGAAMRRRAAMFRAAAELVHDEEKMLNRAINIKRKAGGKTGRIQARMSRCTKARERFNDHANQCDRDAASITQGAP